MFNSIFDFNIRESEALKVTTELLEVRKVKSSDLLQMQRFHKSVMCFENEKKRSCRKGFANSYEDISGITGEVWIPHDANIEDYDWDKDCRCGESNGCSCGRKHIPHDDWRKSANGAWFIYLTTLFNSNIYVGSSFSLSLMTCIPVKIQILSKMCHLTINFALTIQLLRIERSGQHS